MKFEANLKFKKYIPKFNSLCCEDVDEKVGIKVEEFVDKIEEEDGVKLENKKLTKEYKGTENFFIKLDKVKIIEFDGKLYNTQIEFSKLFSSLYTDINSNFSLKCYIDLKVYFFNGKRGLTYSIPKIKISKEDKKEEFNENDYS